MISWRTLRSCIGLVFVVSMSLIARADSQGNVRAARLTYAQGTVTVSQANQAPVPAQMNLPLLAGIQLNTGSDGQAEVEFEDGSVIRLTPNSALSLDNLSISPDGVFVTDVSLQHGLAYAELRAAQQYHYAINAGGDVLSPVENTTVRINFDQPPAVFSVLDGTAEVERVQQAGSGYQTDVRAGESLTADASDPTRYFLTQGIAQDSWDQWNQDLDQSAATQASDSTDVRNDYAGPDGYGWSDLDANGSWYNVPGQGPVWQPTVAEDDSAFDPYGAGGWISYPGAGAIWASAYPWGWTPYRCGSWSYFNSFGWGWAPGQSCGTLGWGFAGGGHPVNIGLAPLGYRPIRVPAPGHGPERPWIPVHTYVASGAATRPVSQGPRQLAGMTVTPIRPAHTSSTEFVAGSSLSRDYPVDSATRTPVLGLASTRPTSVYSVPGTAPSARPARGNPATITGTTYSPYEGQSHPPNQVIRTPPPGQPVRPNQSVQPRPASSQPMQRPSYTPRSAPAAPRSAPAPAHGPK